MHVFSTNNIHFNLRLSEVSESHNLRMKEPRVAEPCTRRYLCSNVVATATCKIGQDGAQSDRWNSALTAHSMMYTTYSPCGGEIRKQPGWAAPHNRSSPKD